MGQWKVDVGATVEIGEELGTILVEAGREQRAVEAAVPAAESVESGRHARRYSIEPALSPTITRKLSRVIPANLQIDARWDATRAGRVDAMNAPVVISSLGAFGVRAAAPIVVPPSVGTLFIGSAHREMLPNGKKNETAEVITLSLTFDHRVVNGAGAANFVHDIKERLEKFTIPSKAAVAKA